jgi:hypothetical protein
MAKKRKTHSIGNLAALHFAAALLCLPLKSYYNPDGVYSESELYTALTDLTFFVFSDTDPTKSWAHRRDAKRSIEKLGKIMEAEIAKLKNPASGFLGRLAGGIAHKPAPPQTALKDYGVNLVKRLLASGKSTQDVAWVLLWSGCAFVANTGCAVSYYSSWPPPPPSHWRRRKDG